MGPESIHLDKYGKVLKNEDDGDNNVYLHRNGKTKKDIEKKYSSNNTSAGGEAIGQLGGDIDVNEILTNLLDRNAKIAEGKNIIGWVGLVNTNKDWDLKNNTETIFGLAWKFDGRLEADKFTNFLYKGLKMNGYLNAADIGNYHAGFTGINVGIPRYLQYVGAGFFELKKQGSNSRFNPTTYLSAPFGDMARDYFFNRAGIVEAQRIPVQGVNKRRIIKYGPFN